MQFEMLCFDVVHLASEYENEQGLELFCGTCLVECCALLSQGQTRVSSGQKDMLNHGGFALGLHCWRCDGSGAPCPFLVC